MRVVNESPLAAMQVLFCFLARWGNIVEANVSSSKEEQYCQTIIEYSS